MNTLSFCGKLRCFEVLRCHLESLVHGESALISDFWETFSMERVALHQ
jgi:hypothetical protein